MTRFLNNTCDSSHEPVTAQRKKRGGSLSSRVGGVAAGCYLGVKQPSAESVEPFSAPSGRAVGSRWSSGSAATVLLSDPLSSSRPAWCCRCCCCRSGRCRRHQVCTNAVLGGAVEEGGESRRSQASAIATATVSPARHERAPQGEEVVFANQQRRCRPDAGWSATREQQAPWFTRVR